MPHPVAFNDQLLDFNDREAAKLQTGEIRIHRIFPFERFVDLLRANQLTLAKPHRWDDQFENPFNSHILDQSTGRTVHASEFETSTFAQCWSTLDESDAMWRIYSPDKRSILVSVNARELLSSATFEFGIGYPFERLYLGKVRYFPEQEIRENLESPSVLKALLNSPSYSSAAARTLLVKRDSFAHENEVRLILCRHVSEVPGDFAKLNIDTPQCIVQVKLDPRLSGEEVDRQRFLLQAAGCKQPIDQSTIYATPKVSLSIPSIKWLYQQA